MNTPVFNKVFYGSPRTTWSSYWDVSEIEENTKMTLQVYDLEQTLLLEQEFFIDVSQDKETAPQ